MMQRNRWKGVALYRSKHELIEKTVNSLSCWLMIRITRIRWCSVKNNWPSPIVYDKRVNLSDGEKKQIEKNSRSNLRDEYPTRTKFAALNAIRQERVLVPFSLFFLLANSTKGEPPRNEKRDRSLCAVRARAVSLKRSRRPFVCTSLRKARVLEHRKIPCLSGNARQLI